MNLKNDWRALSFLFILNQLNVFLKATFFFMITTKHCTYPVAQTNWHNHLKHQLSQQAQAHSHKD